MNFLYHTTRLLRPILFVPLPIVLRWPLAKLANMVFRRLKLSGKVQTRYGQWLFCNTEEVIQRHIALFGVWEPHLSRLVEQNLAEGDVFIDVGANIGYFSLLAAKLVGPNGACIAIEASPDTHSLLRANIAVNGLATIQTHNLAASDAAGVLYLVSGPRSNTGTTSVQKENPGTMSPAVACKRLDDLLDPAVLPRVKLIKIDVEGAELAVVKGMAGVLAQGPRNLIVAIEIVPQRMPGGMAAAEEIFQCFHRQGFRAFQITNSYHLREYLSFPRSASLSAITAPTLEPLDVVFFRE